MYKQNNNSYSCFTIRCKQTIQNTKYKIKGLTLLELGQGWKIDMKTLKGRQNNRKKKSEEKK